MTYRERLHQPIELARETRWALTILPGPRRILPEVEHAVRFSYNRNAWVTFDDNTLRARFAVANVLAWPLGFYLLDRWLDHFVYRIDLHVGYFLLATQACRPSVLPRIDWLTKLN